jgi:colicin import membrane protein
MINITKVIFLLSRPVQLVSALLLCLAMNAQAVETIAERSAKLETEVVAFHQSYPARSLDSVARAESAIAEAEKLQTKLQNLSTESESACFERFLVNACIDDARHLRRKLQDLVRRVSFEAKAYLRQQRGAKIRRESVEPVSEGS